MKSIHIDLRVARNTSKTIFASGGNEAATVAYAAHCQQEKSLDRPIAGHTNICPASIVDGEKEIAMLTSTIKHELLHALGFSLRYKVEYVIERVKFKFQ